MVWKRIPISSLARLGTNIVPKKKKVKGVEEAFLTNWTF